MKPIVLDLFAGCGGFSLGFERAGFDVRYFVECWEPAILSHLRNFPKAELVGTDITKISDETIKELGRVDVVIGGPPCQGFSLVGKRRVDDPRNGLYKHFLRFVKVLQPRLVVMENVPGILSMKSPEGERVVSHIFRDLISLGYFVSCKKLRVSDFGISQKRERVFIVGLRKDVFPVASFDLSNVVEALEGIPEKWNGHEVRVPSVGVLKRIKNLKQGEKLSKSFNFSRQRLRANEPCPTVTTKELFIHPFEDRFLTPRELARLQSFPDGFSFVGSKMSMIRQIGNAVPPKLAELLAKSLRGEVFV